MRRLRVHRVLSPVTGGALALFLLQAGCDTGTAPGEDDGVEDGDNPDDDGDDVTDQADGDDRPDEVGAAVWIRGSLVPNFDMPNAQEQNKFEIPRVEVVGGAPETLSEQQFLCNAGGFLPLQQKMFEIESQIAAEREEGGDTAPVEIIESDDEDTATEMAWRSNPTDIDCIDVDGERKCIVPLGGDTSTPGNTVAILVGSGADQILSEEIDVGVRPIHTTCHPDGVCFVANLYSNYISVIDMVAEQPLIGEDGNPVEIPVDYYTSDLVIAEVNPGGDFDDNFYLFAANQWLGSVSRYDLRVVLGGLDAGVDDVERVNEVPTGSPESTPDRLIAGVGVSPDRLRLSEQQDAVYVANALGGEIAIVDASSGEVSGYSGVGAPAVDIIEVQNNVFVATTTPDRGLLAQDEQVPQEFNQPPVRDEGVDGQQVEVHQGALLDRTKAYNFEDLHNGIVSLNPTLNEQNIFQQTIFTDLTSAEENFNNNQKQLTATLPGNMETDGAGTLLVVGEGNDVVQKLDINGGANFPLENLDGEELQTGIRPMAMFVDKVRDEVVVVTWGAGLAETFDLNGGAAPIEQIALPGSGDDLDGVIDDDEYPCSDLEIGEYAYYNTEYSNNGSKSCTTCHRKDLLTDGGAWSNGVTSPTTYHKIIPSWNQTFTDNYFWNGSFDNDSYLSLAFAAQTRTQCELILFGLTEGPGKPANQRVGDIGNNGIGGNIVNGNGNEAICQPLVINQNTDELPNNFVDEIAPEIAAEKLVADQVISDIVQANVNKQLVNNNDPNRPLNRVEVSRLMDWWMVSQDRVPPNPLTYLNANGQAGEAVEDLISRGADVFESAGCVICHDPGGPGTYSDGKLHGRGAEYVDRFIDRYDGSGLVNFAIAQMTKDANQNLRGSEGVAGEEINLHLAIDTFMPFAFDEENILFFEDPLNEQVGSQAELDTLLRLRLVNSEDAERGMIPGSVEGQTAVNTPSLRGVWWNPVYLHHGMAKSFREAISGPGHPELRSEVFLMNAAHPDLIGEERGWAFNITGSTDAHGTTSDLSDADLTALEYFVNSIP